MDSKTYNLLLVFFLLFFLFSGAVALCVGIVIGAVSYSTTSWPQTQGTIIESNVSVDDHRGGENSKVHYSAIIKYKYIISGKTYVGNRLYTFRFATPNKESVLATCKQYKVGSDVTVYFDPRYPEKSVLIPGTPKGVWTLIYVGTISILIGAGGTFFVVRFACPRLLNDAETAESKPENGIS